MFPDSMFVALKKVMGGKGARKAAERRMQKIAEQHDEFLRFHRRYDPQAYTGVPFPDYRPEEWPSKFHNKCDIEWCGFTNCPTTAVEMAAAVALDIERRRRKKETSKTIRTLDPVDSGLLRSSGKSAMEYRRQRLPSFSSVATAPTLVRFPQQPDMYFKPNPLHPQATSTRRDPRPSLSTRSHHPVRF
ncbi:hypothetical protein B0H12DRAFT_1231418 [Mycena haematopus]|nr:hypothetical protein B0H12DRAFT_1231418 [Mycena haematopus]